MIQKGFFSKFLLIRHWDGKESQSEFDDFYASANKHYQTVGWLEELWVEKTAVWSWRLRRLIRVRVVKLPELLPGIVASSSNRGQTIWQNRSPHH
jgi:hypothetical protein